MIYGYVYKTTNLKTGRLYIGKRRGQFAPRYLGSGWALHSSIKKYGLEAFRVEVLVFANSVFELNWLESHCIAEYREFYGKRHLYNIADGGNGGNCTAEMAAKGKATKLSSDPDFYRKVSQKTIETRRRNGTLKSTPEQISRAMETRRRRDPDGRKVAAKMIATKKERGTIPTGDKHPLFGTKRPESVTRAISEKLKGRKQLPEMVAKRVAKNKGQRRSPEQRARQSAAAIKRWANTPKEKRIGLDSQRRHVTNCACAVCRKIRQKYANINLAL